MKKLIGVLAIASVLSFVLMGCSAPVEGDPATAPVPDATKTDKGVTPSEPPSAQPKSTA